MVAAINLADNIDAARDPGDAQGADARRRPEIRRPVARRASLDRRRHPRSARRDVRAAAPQPRRQRPSTTCSASRSENDIPVLPQIALAHAQFETIHPFTDGNGRTGRALIQAMLRGKGLTQNVTVPVSAGLLTDTDSYFAALTAYREGDPAPIVGRVAEAAVTAVINGRELVNELRAMRTEWSDRITARSDSAVWQIADLLLRRPVINTALLTEELGIDSKHARRYLEPLSEAGVIIETSSGPRQPRTGARQRSSPHSMPLANARAGAGWDDEGNGWRT